MEKLLRAATLARFAARQQRLAAGTPVSAQAGALESARQTLWNTLEAWWSQPFQQQQTLRLGFEGLASPNDALAQRQQGESLAERAERSAADAVEALESLWKDGLLFAVPKHRVTRSKKRIRQHNKYVKRKLAFSTCTTCGEKHLPHHLCPFCNPFNKFLSKKDVGKKNPNFDIW
ncbi:39S ribosomal protein L32, mitochondrial [Hondaea fermentalgiana]|uniref:Large ribosomal subunit protein bL32m n=1 Tax=Hondaea fermentalgiana TaxID=2315210 RepID=A0A2R5GNF1_9STRA|nr:39S ribosomal protein L32, mitochondrial [Hondaea fermentalgiana]|eukprot:GBG29831.1 39S ribosomal protein L32, mitochondrial [Hondaea fermentalgiana]